MNEILSLSPEWALRKKLLRTNKRIAEIELELCTKIDNELEVLLIELKTQRYNIEYHLNQIIQKDEEDAFLDFVERWQDTEAKELLYREG